MAQAHRLDCESAAAECRAIIQSENEAQAIGLAREHVRAVDGMDYSDEERRTDHLEVV